MDCNFEFLMRRVKGLFLTLKFIPLSSSCNQKMGQVSVTKWNGNKWRGIYFCTALWIKSFFTDEHQNGQLNASIFIILYFSPAIRMMSDCFELIRFGAREKRNKRMPVNIKINIQLLTFLQVDMFIRTIFP